MNNSTIGIYVIDERKFYYIESGRVAISNNIDRLRRILRQRGVLTLNPYQGKFEDKYEVTTVEKAKLNDWEIVPVYISKHVKETVEVTPAKQGTNSGWAK